MTPVDDFVGKLRIASEGLVRVPLDVVWRVFLKCRPELAASPDKRSELARWLDAAALVGAFVQPKVKTLFDRSAKPLLPLWVAFPSEKVPAATFDHRAHPWHAHMSFVAGLPRLLNLEDALALNRYFVANRDLPLVPTKERSYAIFGDEKRLASILSGSLGSGLSHDVLRCYDPSFIPVHLMGSPDSRRVLIVENEATFDTFSRWNKLNQVWSAVIWGRGLEVTKAVNFLRDTWPATSRFDYFGDFDQEGVCIASRLAASMRGIDRQVTPLTPAYRILSREPAHEDAKTHTTDWPVAVQWLEDPEIIAVATAAFSVNRRVAQEALGWERLCPLGPAAFSYIPSS